MKIRIAVPAFVLVFGLATTAVPLAVGAQDAEVPAYLEVRDVPHGTVHDVSYRSTALGTNRDVVVYTPPGYEASSDRYPVLYLLHGAGGTQTTWTERGRAHVILDNMIADGALAPLVVVMPFGYAFQRESGVVDVIGTVGYYGLVSLVLNTDEYPLPEGVEVELQPLD